VTYQTPRYQEVKMDAEIGSYQPDGDTSPDGYVERHDDASADALDRAQVQP
jgi:hypothetical protein